MEEPVDHAAMPACGYVRPWSVKAGGRVALHASSADAGAAVGLCRLDGPAGPGPLSWGAGPGEAALGHRTLVRGSWAELEVPAQGSLLRLEFLLTANASGRTLLSWGDLTVSIGADRRLGVDGTVVGPPLPAWRWLTLTLAGTPDGMTTTVDGQAPKVAFRTARRLPAARLVRLGRGAHGPAANWRLGRIAWRGDGGELDWHLPVQGPVAAVAPVGGAGPALRIRNDPTFSCRSARWDGSVHDPRLAGDHYDAVHFHEDDLGSPGWPSARVADVPADARPGIYAFTVATDRGTEEIPFFVRPAAPRAPIAFLVPAMTYAAYADEALPQARFPWACDDRGHRFAQANGLASLYDEHADGSGVSLKNLDQPKATLRRDYRYPLSDCPHLLPVDLRLLDFCHANAIAFDLLTDGDLHAEGAAALRPYAGLFTGSHPEYWTTPMQAALGSWLAEGGNLAYLGGNGLMWVTACDGERVEVRRGQTLGGRTWDGLPGEINLSLTGEIGGMWRERGRPEFGVVGTGMTLMGFGPARPYRRLPASEDPAWAWIFDGVGPGPIGKGGGVLGGAAGYEVDRADARLGTPEGTVVLARADGFGPEYEIDGNDYFPGGAAERLAARRADMVARRHEGGGFVFGVGSVAWCGALPAPGGDNPVGRITANVLRALARRR